jgi:hypothetical protein
MVSEACAVRIGASLSNADPTPSIWIENVHGQARQQDYRDRLPGQAFLDALRRCEVIALFPGINYVPSCRSWR